MPRWLRWIGQGVVLAAAAALVGVFADAPAYHRFSPDDAQLLVSLSHGGKPKGGCRTLSAEELARTAANMRRPKVCSRERLPVTVEITLDGKPLLRRTAPPGGLSGDAPSRIYQRFSVAAGSHRLTARLRDSARADGFDYERTADIRLKPRQRLVIDFHAPSGGFLFR